MKKIKEFFLSNVFVRPKVIIFLTIVAIVVLTVALLTGCGGQNADLQNAGWKNFFFDIGPAWSPDGSKIAFVKTTYFNQGSNWGVIWVMNADGSNKTKLTDDTEKLNSPAWSPDGSKIAFGSGGNWLGNCETWVMNADGSNKIKLTNKYNSGSPTWSPDGSKIAFSPCYANNNVDVWVMNADGSNKINLTGN